MNISNILYMLCLLCKSGKEFMIRIRFIALLLLLLIMQNLSAQDTWIRSYNPFEYEWIYGSWEELEVFYYPEDILVTQDGGFIVSGSFDRSIPDDPPVWWDHWGFLMKTDSEGNLLWAKKDSVSFMGDNDNYAVVETIDGDLISIDYSYSGGCMIKRDAMGNRIWDMSYNDFGANSMCRTNDGNITMGGVVAGDISLRKIDNDGNTIWTNSHDCGTSSIAQSIYQTQNDEYLLTGTIYHNSPPIDIFVVKTDSNGDTLWTKTYVSMNGNDQGKCIIETNENDIVIGGNICNTSGFPRGFLWKLDPFGNTLWTQYYEEGPIFYLISLLHSEHHAS